MGFESKTCVVAACDGGCGNPWPERETPHFGGLVEAVGYLRRLGWLVTGDRLFCPPCTSKEASVLGDLLQVVSVAEQIAEESAGGESRG